MAVPTQAPTPTPLDTPEQLTEALTAARKLIGDLRAAVESDGLAHIRFTGTQLQRVLELVAGVASDSNAVVESCPAHWDIPSLGQKGSLKQWAEMLDGDDD